MLQADVIDRQKAVPQSDIKALLQQNLITTE
jgi:hypothetical protein